MHGLVDAPHVDHLHPDSGIALATAADGEKLTAECFGDRVVWVPWRRPGFQLGLDIAAIAAANPQAIGCILGGHGITAWGATSEECEARSLEIIRHRDGSSSRRTAARSRSARSSAGYRAAAGGGAARPGGRAGPGDPRPGLDRPAAGRPLHRHRGRAGLHVPGGAPAAGRAGHVVPGPLPAHQGAADGPRPAAGRAAGGRRGPAAGAARGLPRRTTRPTTSGTPTPDYARDARRRPGDRAGAGHRHVQLRRDQADGPGGRGVLRQRDQRDARRRGPLDVRTDRRGREVPDRVLGTGGGQARPAARAQAAGRPDRAGHRGGLAASAGPSRCGSPPRAPAWWSPTATRTAPQPSPRRSVSGRLRAASPLDRRRDRRRAVAGGRRCGGAGLRRRRPGGEQRRAVGFQAAARDDRGGLGPSARRDGTGRLPGVEELPPGP